MALKNIKVEQSEEYEAVGVCSFCFILNAFVFCVLKQNKKAAEAAEKRRLRSRSRSAVPAEEQAASGDEEQFEEVRFSFVLLFLLVKYNPRY